MVNEWCVSSCDGFAWTMKAKLDAKLYGFPQAADSAYSRLRIDALWDVTSADGFRIAINPERERPADNFIVGQVVAVTRATDENGVVFNGHPVPLEKTVPYRFREFYPQKVLQSVLSDF